MLKITIGHSDDIDSADAIAEVIEQCQDQKYDLPVKAGILYAAIDHDFAILLKKINEAYPGIHLIGGTTDGELTSEGGFAEDSIVLALFQSEDVEITAGVVKDIGENLSDSVQKEVERTVAQMEHQPKICIINPTGIGINGDNLLHGFQQALGVNFPLFGGMAGDQFRLKKTYQFYLNEIYESAIPYLLLGGSFQYSFGVDCGWQPVGKKGVVSQSEGNIIYTIDEEPALDFYKNYLGEHYKQFIDLPFAVYQDQEDDFYLRGILFADEETGAITCLGAIPKGAIVQITHATRENILEACDKTIEQSISGFEGEKIEAAICFSCAGRKHQLGTQTFKETEKLKAHNADLDFFGFYSYGEFCPLQFGSPSRFHNATFVTLLIGA